MQVIMNRSTRIFSQLNSAMSRRFSTGTNKIHLLPEELSRKVVVLDCPSTAEGGWCSVYLVGTCHVSKQSCKEVQAVISCLKPQVVFLELCSSRASMLTAKELKIPTMGEIMEMWKKNHNLFGLLYSWVLVKVANQLEVVPGFEFRVASDQAKKYGSEVILGDRPIEITLRRTWDKMPLWHKTKLFYYLLYIGLALPRSEVLEKMLKKMGHFVNSRVEDMGDADMWNLVIEKMGKEFPTLVDTIVHERDQFMSYELLEVARKHSSVVAVVGKGHLQGIKKHWQQPVPIEKLLEMPPSKPTIFSGSKVF